MAKMAATLDVISNGRLEFGIGAGWYEAEYTAYGISFPKTSVRIQQLREGIEIIKKMWTEEKATFDGKYYAVKDAICSPKPVQKPYPPIWIAGLGEKLTLRVVAEAADGCNFFGLTPDEYRHKSNVLRRHCLNVGREPDDIQKSWSGIILIAEDERELNDRIHEFKSNGVLVEDKVAGKHIMGTPEQCLEQVKQYVDAGVTYFILHFLDVWETKPLQLFADNVIRAFRGD
jgi:alkanesulfonate monooxygenase SsuD/methylene tetrahydromethanopterin reductase-like flavin-dependent oxidoreductase (luciferase family)